MDGLEAVYDFSYGGVIDTLFAEGEGDGGAGALDLGVDDGALDLGVDDDTEGAAGGGGEEGQLDDKIDGRKGSKEFRDALKAWEATPEGAKYAKQARADHFRANEIATIEPGGVTAMREKYALLESIGGVEGLTTIQERVAEADGIDEALAAGKIEALESLGPEFDPGLAKLTPQILDRVMKSDPAAYAAAILPHLMSGLTGSPMVGDLNRMVDALQAPHLDDAGKIKAVTQLLGRIGQWFDANEKKAGEFKAAPVDKQHSEFDQERSKFDQEKQDHHWNTNIIPDVARAEATKFDDLLKPYMSRLKLSPAQKAAALSDFRSKLRDACNADSDYKKQRDFYRKQKNPAPATVANFAKAHLAKKAQAAFDLVKAERFGNFLGGAKKPATAVVPGARTTTTGAAPVIVSVRPSPDEIDYRKTSEEDQWKGRYTLKTGKVVQVRKQA